MNEPGYVDERFVGMKRGAVVRRIALVWAILASTVPAVARIEVSASIDTTSGYVGDRFSYEVRVVHSEDDSVLIPPHGINLHAFRILDYVPTTSEMSDGTIVQGGRYRITAFKPGTYIIPPLPVRYWTASGDSGELTTQSLTVEIVSLGVTAADSLRGLKPPKSVPVRLRPWVRNLIFATAFAVALGIALLIWLARRRRKTKVDRRPVVIDELAEFDRIRLDEYLSRNDVAGFYDAVSDQMRRYVSRRYRIAALEMTVDEIRFAFLDNGVAPDESSEILAFLERCDLVKFAKFIPDDEEVRSLIERAKDVVTSTRTLSTSTALEEAAKVTPDETAEGDS